MDSKWLKAILASGALLAVAVGVGIYGVSVVQASSGPEPMGSIASPSSAAHSGFGSGTGDMQVLLAEALGISVEELEAAQKAAFETFIAIAVDEGRITQEQAGQILEGDGFPVLLENSSGGTRRSFAFCGIVGCISHSFFTIHS